MDKTGDKFAKGSSTAWNNSVRPHANSLDKRGKKSVVSDFRNARHSKRQDTLINAVDSSEHLAKHSNMANTINQEMTTTTGFKNIQDYL